MGGDGCVWGGAECASWALGGEVAEDGCGGTAAFDGVVGGVGDFFEGVDGAAGGGVAADLLAETAEGTLGGDALLNVGLGGPVDELDLGHADVGGGDEEVAVGVEDGGEEVLVLGGEGNGRGCGLGRRDGWVGGHGCVRRIWAQGGGFGWFGGDGRKTARAGGVWSGFALIYGYWATL